MGSLAIERFDAPARELAARSRAWRADERMDASLLLGAPTDEALVLGAFQRASEIGSDAPEHSIVQRGSGGGAARVGAGSVWLQLALARPDALVACTPDKLLNRYVRPLLRALTKVTSTPASYFGRDWISAAHRPVALVAFAHEAKTNAALFEAIVAVSTPFAAPGRPSFLGKAPATLEEVAAGSIDLARVVDAIADAYRELATSTVEVAPRAPAPVADEDLASASFRTATWTATREEAIGLVAAGPDASGRLRVGGELMASSDAIARLEDRLGSLPAVASEDDVGRAVDEALTTGGAITFGVRSLASIRDVIVEARRRNGG